MTRMIPRWIDDEAPASERRVFEKLERDPAAGNWTVLHSLGLARRRTGPYGEIDFVVVVPGEGIILPGSKRRGRFLRGRRMADPKPFREGQADQEPGAIRVATISRFKGLESDVVVMVNVDAMEGARNESLLYVGMTRARALLILLIVDTTEARGVWEPRFQEIARRAAGDPDQTA